MENSTIVVADGRIVNIADKIAQTNNAIINSNYKTDVACLDCNGEISLIILFKQRQNTTCGALSPVHSNSTWRPNLRLLLKQPAS